MNYTRTASVDTMVPVWLGDKVYTVEEDQRGVQSYNPMCPACSNTRVIKAKGDDGSEYEVECPLCKRSSYSHTGNYLRLGHIIINEYIVNKVALGTPDTKKLYKGGAIPRIAITSMSAFNSTESCKNIPLYSSAFIHSLDDLPEPSGRTYGYFLTKKEAEKAVEVYTERDKKKLRDFNEKYGTDYEYPW